MRTFPMQGLIIFLALGMFFGVSSSPVARQTSDAGPSMGSAPIPGELTTLVDARTRAAYPILTIPPAAMIHPCLGTAFTLQLKDVWASSTAVAQSERQVGLTYNSGIWVSFTPKSWYQSSIASATELPPVSLAFSSDDFPDSLTTGVVRGHTAWIAEVSPGICAGQSESGGGLGEIVPDPTSGLGPLQPTATLPFPEGLMGHLEWMEGGTVIHLAGPYPAAHLQALASSMSGL